MFSKILIANRGEIACRIATTARRMGIQTVAVYSDADALAKHVALCDAAVRLGPAPARESYLLPDALIAAAKDSGAQAIHPGYGFLSENAPFAEQCAAAGIRFIGPPAASIRAMGSKSAAKSLMERASVPLVPGYHGDNQDPTFLQTQADAMGYPVLIKASAGGGGKGMRVVESSAAFTAALESCKREAAASFGSDLVLVEKYLTRPRHIEIQVFADSHGQCVYLFERDCSVQRRHQKVLEEAPAPGMDLARRQSMGAAAVAAARAVGYEGAGTVEFIADHDGQFYFMEMNTRLQVEHPVTEMISGFDLVEWQLRVAAGEPLPRSQDELAIRGHAIEARIYAENPERGFLPSTGTLSTLRLPAAVEFAFNSDLEHVHAPAAVRIDSGVREGDVISPYYDPMIAKLITWGEDRQQALARMAAALAETRIVGVATNVAFLSRLIASTAFSSADLDTGLIERNHAELFPAQASPGVVTLALGVASILGREADPAPSSPWTALRGWRMNLSLKRSFTFLVGDTPHTVELTWTRDGMQLGLASSTQSLVVLASQEQRFELLLAGRVVRGTVVTSGDALHIFEGAAHETLTYLNPLAHLARGEAQVGKLTAPMPGKIVSVLKAVGQSVVAGDPLLVMEAMKMEHTISAPGAGTVEAIHFGVGDQVEEGVQLITLAVVAAT